MIAASSAVATGTMTLLPACSPLACTAFRLLRATALGSGVPSSFTALQVYIIKLYE